MGGPLRPVRVDPHVLVRLVEEINGNAPGDREIRLDLRGQKLHGIDVRPAPVEGRFGIGAGELVLLRGR